MEATRLGLYALTKLRAYDALAAAVLDQQGQPVSRWWPVAYALQRVGDPRAAPTLLTLLGTPGRYTASFAARGLASTKATQASGPLREIVTERVATRRSSFRPFAGWRQSRIRRRCQRSQRW